MKNTAALFISLCLLLAPDADSISINPNGSGEFIIAPYFTVHNGLDTYVNISNTTDASKAIKILFMDGYGAHSMRYFNFYLGPWESFAFALSQVESISFPDRPVAAINFNDNACANIESGTRFNQTLPLIPGVLLETREGWIQVVEMGELIDGPSGCEEIRANTSNLTRPSGGIQASVSIIDVAKGIQFAYKPTHFIDFFPEDGAQNYFYENMGVHPSIYHASPQSNGYTYESGVHAISAEISKSQLVNQFNVENGIAAETEWVLTFPTKRTMHPGNECIRARSANLYDRKGNDLVIYNNGDDIDPQLVSTDLDFCAHINVLKFGDNPEKSILNSLFQTGFSGDFNVLPGGVLKHGQMRLNFVSDVDASTLVITGESNSGNIEVHGAPVLGFGIQKYHNASAQPGLLAQYGTSYPHSYKEDKRLLE